MKIFLSVSALIFLCVLPMRASASAFDFADSLFQEGDYLNAAHEYKRILFLHPDTTHIDFIAFRVAASYQNAGQLEKAIRAYQFLIDTYPDSPLVERSTNNIAQCHILLGDKERGIASLENFLAKHKSSDLAPLAHFTIGMLHIDRKEWAAASGIWNDVFLTYPESRFAEVSAKLAGIVENVDVLPRRSPTVAGVLSALVPGSGQVYSGRRVDGFYTFMSVAVLGSASVYYARKERYEVAIPVAALGLLLYGNNIYQGIQAAETFNLQHEERFRNQIQQEIRDSGLFGAISMPKDNVKLTVWHARF
ncbi:tetratricopeptide repeat protein [Candidatus Poribacteria bacterium]|nr:tetratricopeptide repeat protein [Candidatus Poribacteria bacterium]MXY27309.1 tetratricopeptide repeat protein [Candidatus Poribacteria bacterium]MYK17351.1 tetratricopeptide repeat protein [Candidatus Poribacteria bacterium]